MIFFDYIYFIHLFSLINKYILITIKSDVFTTQILFQKNRFGNIKVYTSIYKMLEKM